MKRNERSFDFNGEDVTVIGLEQLNIIFFKSICSPSRTQKLIFFAFSSVVAASLVTYLLQLLFLLSVPRKPLN